MWEMHLCPRFKHTVDIVLTKVFFFNKNLTVSLFILSEFLPTGMHKKQCEHVLFVTDVLYYQFVYYFEWIRLSM